MSIPGVGETAGEDGAPEAARAERELRVYRAARSHRALQLVRRWTVEEGFGERRFLQVAFPLAVTLPLDAPRAGLWPAGAAWVPVPPASAVLAVLGAAWVLNAGLGVRLLRRGRGPASSPLGTLLRGLASGVPLLGFLWLPVVGRLLAGRAGSVPRRRSGRAAWLELLLRRHVDDALWPLLWLFVGNLAVLLAIALWTAAPQAAVPRPAVVAASLLCHLMAGAAACGWARGLRAGGLLAAVSWLAVALVVLPSPASLGGLLWLMLVEQRRGGESTLVWKATARGTVLARMPAWSEPLRRLDGHWRESPWWRRPFEPAGEAAAVVEERPLRRAYLLSFCRLKMLIAFFEGYGLGLAAAATGAAAAATGLQAVLLALLVAGGCGYLWQALLRLAAVARLRPFPPPRPQAWFLLLAAVCVLSGFALGRHLPGWPAADGARLLLASTTLAAVLAGLRLVTETATEPSREQDRLAGRHPGLLWAAFFLLAPTLVAVALATDGRGRCLLAAFAVAAPLAGAALGAAFLGRLLDPLSVPALVRGDLRRSERLLAWSVALSAVLPLGALAAPLWLLAGGRLARAADEGGARWS